MTGGTSTTSPRAALEVEPLLAAIEEDRTGIFWG